MKPEDDKLTLQELYAALEPKFIAFIAELEQQRLAAISKAAFDYSSSDKNSLAKAFNSTAFLIYKNKPAMIFAVKNSAQSHTTGPTELNSIRDAFNNFGYGLSSQVAMQGSLTAGKFYKFLEYLEQRGQLKRLSLGIMQLTARRSPPSSSDMYVIIPRFSYETSVTFKKRLKTFETTLLIEKVPSVQETSELMPFFCSIDYFAKSYYESIKQDINSLDNQLYYLLPRMSHHIENRTFWHYFNPAAIYGTVLPPNNIKKVYEYLERKGAIKYHFSEDSYGMRWLQSPFFTPQLRAELEQNANQFSRQQQVQRVVSKVASQVSQSVRKEDSVKNVKTALRDKNKELGKLKAQLLSEEANLKEFYPSAFKAWENLMENIKAKQGVIEFFDKEREGLLRQRRRSLVNSYVTFTPLNEALIKEYGELLDKNFKEITNQLQLKGEDSQLDIPQAAALKKVVSLYRSQLLASQELKKLRGEVQDEEFLVAKGINKDVASLGGSAAMDL